MSTAALVIKVNDELPLNVCAIRGDNSQVPTVAKPAWSTNAPNIAQVMSVDPNGNNVKVYGVSPGYATITVAADTFTATIVIQVIANATLTGQSLLIQSLPAKARTPAFSGYPPIAG